MKDKQLTSHRLARAGDYTYDWLTGVYLDRYGNLVGWNDVNNNYVLPNAAATITPVKGESIASFSFSDNSVTIGFNYPDAFSSIIVNGQRVGADIVNVSLGNSSGGNDGAGFDPSLTAMFSQNLFMGPGLNIVGYSTKTKEGSSNVEFVTNVRTKNLESVNYYYPMGNHLSVGMNGNVTYGGILSLGVNPNGSLVIDLSLPTGETSSVGMTINFNEIEYERYMDTAISNALGDALDRMRNRPFGLFPIGDYEPLIPVLP